mgnify:CR=1 FL=1
MKKYAMILNDRVIDVVEKDFPPVYPPTPDGYQITAMICDDTVMVGDIVVDGEIIGTAPEPEPAQPTNQDIMDKLNTMTTGQVSTAELDAAYREGVNAYE